MTLKNIKYRGGLISFDIPSNWIEEYEESGGGTFYEDSPVSGTLRVNVLTIKKNDTRETDISAVDTIKIGLSERSGVEIIDEYDSNNGDRIIESITRAIESNTPIIIYRFDCIHKTILKDYLLAMFTWTIEAKFENVEDYITDFNMIKNSILKITFGR